MKRASLFFIVLVVLGRALNAQIPSTPAGRQFLAWQQAQDSLDRAVIQQFIDTIMPWGRVDAELGIRNQTGGFDVKKVEESSETHIVLLARERGSGQQFVTITLNVAADTPYQIRGIRIQPAQPPPELAPPKMTEAEIAAARTAAPFRQFSAWLDAFNTGDRTRLSEFSQTNFPSMNVNAQMNFRANTGGFELRAIEQASATTLVGLVQERDSDQFARFVIIVEPTEPYRITSLPINAIPRPPEFPVARMSEAEILPAVRAKVEKDVAADRFAGTVLLAKDNKVLFSGAYGLADREMKVVNGLDTRFRIGSMNKMFTAVAILQLVQAGKLKLTDVMGNYLTEYPNKDVATKVTIHHLLTHTGGVGDIFGPEFNARRLELRTLNDYVALYGNRPLEFEPGSRWVYSNYGMLLLGVIIEKVTGQTYYDYVSEHIYKPAGMTFTGSEPESAAVSNRSIGYMRSPAGMTPNTNTLPYRGTSAGGGYSTVGDLLKFAHALMEHTLLNAEYTELLITGKVNSEGGRRYAYGFEDDRKDGVGAVGHGGGAPGMNGDLRIYPQSGYVVAVLSNLDPPAAQQLSTFLDLRLPQ